MERTTQNKKCLKSTPRVTRKWVTTLTDYDRLLRGTTPTELQVTRKRVTRKRGTTATDCDNKDNPFFILFQLRLAPTTTTTTSWTSSCGSVLDDRITTTPIEDSSTRTSTRCLYQLRLAPRTTTTSTTSSYSSILDGRDEHQVDYKEEHREGDSPAAENVLQPQILTREICSKSLESHN